MIQYHEEAEGISGEYTGVSIINDTTCSIDLTRNPNGICRKQVTAHTGPDSIIAQSGVSIYIVYAASSQTKNL